MTKTNITSYEMPTITNKAEYLEFKEDIEAHDSFNAVDDENMALELHIGHSIVDFYKHKYENIKQKG